MADEAAISSLYSVVGPEALVRIVAEFYRRVPQDDVLGPMYPPHDLAGAEKRLLAFLTFRFGGPDTYIHERGHPRLRMRHAPFQVNREARDRWLLLMNASIEAARLPDPAAQVMREFLTDTAQFLVNVLEFVE